MRDITGIFIFSNLGQIPSCSEECKYCTVYFTDIVIKCQDFQLARTVGNAHLVNVTLFKGDRNVNGSVVQKEKRRLGYWWAKSREKRSGVLAGIGNLAYRVIMGNGLDRNKYSKRGESR